MAVRGVATYMNLFSRSPAFLARFLCLCVTSSRAHTYNFFVIFFFFCGTTSQDFFFFY